MQKQRTKQNKKVMLWRVYEQNLTVRFKEHTAQVVFKIFTLGLFSARLFLSLLRRRVVVSV